MTTLSVHFEGRSNPSHDKVMFNSALYIVVGKLGAIVTETADVAERDGSNSTPFSNAFKLDLATSFIM